MKSDPSPHRLATSRKLYYSIDDAKEPVDIALPYTVGKWEQAPPVEIALAKGKNVLRITRNEPVKGVSIKDFTLTPVK